MATATQTIRCGNCVKAGVANPYHDSVAAVKACYGYAPLTADATDRYAVEETVERTLASAPAGTRYVLDDIEMAEAESAGDRAEAERVSAAKYGSGQKPVMAEVPAGHYVVTIDGVDKFYRVGYGKEGGRWAGFCFIDAQASSEYWPIKNKDTKNAILAAIRSQGVIECLARYGHALGKCGICSRPLTNPESIERGIGPVCFEGL